MVLQTATTLFVVASITHIVVGDISEVLKQAPLYIFRHFLTLFSSLALPTIVIPLINNNSYFSVPYFGLACDHGNSFLCLEEYEREGYWIEVRTVFNVKTTTTTTI